MTEENRVEATEAAEAAGEATETQDTPEEQLETALEAAGSEGEAHPEGEAQEVQPEVDLNLDFGETLVVQEQSVHHEEPNYDEIVDDLAERLLAKQEKRVQKGELDEGDDEFVSKKDLEAMKAQWKAEMQEEARQKEEAMQVIQQTMQQANAVKDKYVQKMTEKMSQLNIDLDQSPDLKAAADLLWRNLQMNAMQQVGRQVLTAPETEALAREHWKSFSEVFLKSRINSKPTSSQGGETNLSLAGNAVSESAPSSQAGEMSTWEEYQQSKAANRGKADPLKALKVLTELSKQ